MRKFVLFLFVASSINCTQTNCSTGVNDQRWVLQQMEEQILDGHTDIYLNTINLLDRSVDTFALAENILDIWQVRSLYLDELKTTNLDKRRVMQNLYNRLSSNVKDVDVLEEYYKKLELNDFDKYC